MLRALDGVELVVPVDAETRVRVNGLTATLAEIRPGFVAETVRIGSGTAIRVRAFGRIENRVERGRLVGVEDAALVLRRPRAGRLRIAVTERTIVRRHGRQVSLRALRRGIRVEVLQGSDGSARVVRIVRGRR